MLQCYQNASPCTQRPESKHHQNVRIRSTERFTTRPWKVMGALCLKNPNYQQFSAEPFSRKGVRGTNVLVSNPLFLRSDDKVPANLHQASIILCSDKKGQGPKAQPSTSEFQVLAERRGSLCQLVTLPQSVHPAPRLGPSNHCWAC